MTDKLVEEIASWVVMPCMDRTGKHISSWDICVKPESDERGVAVIASVYSGETVANMMVEAAMAQAAATLSHKRIAELEELLRSAHNTMGTAVDCIADGQPARLEYAQERLQSGIDGIRAALSSTGVVG